MTWRTLIVERDGTLESTPSKMTAAIDDGVAWFVDNQSSVKVKVKIKDIHRKNTGAPINPIDFFSNNITVEAGAIGMIAGQIIKFKLRGKSSVLAKYTIELRSTVLDKDYDPDLEIERP